MRGEKESEWVCARAHACEWASERVRVHTHLCIDASVCLCLCMYVCVRACMHAHERESEIASMCACGRAHTHTIMYVCIYVRGGPRIIRPLHCNFQDLLCLGFKASLLIYIKRGSLRQNKYFHQRLQVQNHRTTCIETSTDMIKIALKMAFCWQRKTSLTGCWVED
jgi:hypothetical protein